MSLANLLAIVTLALVAVIVAVTIVLFKIIKTQMRQITQNAASMEGLVTELQINRAYTEGGK